MAGTPFILDEAGRKKLARLRVLAAKRPVEMRGILERLENPDERRRHKRQMSAQTVVLPFGYAVTYSIETGHPIGTCRHMSMSSPAEGRLPIAAVVWLTAEALGFVGDLELCTIWVENLEGHGQAINVVQPVGIAEPPARPD